jgi:hypothetical protein
MDEPGQDRSAKRPLTTGGAKALYTTNLRRGRRALKAGSLKVRPLREYF